MTTYGGLVAQLDIAWTALKRSVGNSGAFQAVKKEVKIWRDYHGRFDTAGMATRFAEAGVGAFELLSRDLRRLVDEFDARSVRVLFWWIQRTAGLFNRFPDNAFAPFSVNVSANLGGVINRIVQPTLSATTRS